MVMKEQAFEGLDRCADDTVGIGKRLSIVGRVAAGVREAIGKAELLLIACASSG